MRLSNMFYHRYRAGKNAKGKYEKRITKNDLQSYINNIPVRIVAVVIVSFIAAMIISSVHITQVVDAIPIPENFSATISNESQDIEAAINDDLKQAQQLMNTGNTTGAIQEIIHAVSLLSSARQDVGP